MTKNVAIKTIIICSSVVGIAVLSYVVGITIYIINTSKSPNNKDIPWGGIQYTDIDYVLSASGNGKFTLPFETYERYRFAPYSGLYFSCDLTLEQMADAVTLAGHRAEIIEFGGHPQIRLYAKTGGTEYMFSISAYNETKYYVRYGN